MCSRCSGLSLLHTCARCCNSCRCAGGRFCSRRLFSRTLCLSCGLRLLNSVFGGVYVDGGRLGLLFGRIAVSPRFMFEFGGRFAPEFCRSFGILLVSCCCCRRSCLCSCLCCCLGGCCCLGDCWLGCCCRGGGWFCCFGGLLSCRFCAQFARGPCAKHGTASAINHPANWSFRFIAGYIF